MKRKPYSWWIKERDNPQLGIYYVPMGQISSTEAMRHERSTLYGVNTMLRFETEAQYLEKIKSLHRAGKSVQKP